METVKVSWSGGKDSTCALMMHLEAGHKVKAVCYVPMLTEEIPLILKNHYEFILNTAERFRAMGAEVYIVSGMTYFDFVYRIRTKGKYKGSLQSFPCFCRGACNFRNLSKGLALEKCNVGYFDYEDIGIAADEFKRKNQLTDTKRSILCDTGTTELDAFRFCVKNSALSPHYLKFGRDGCALCANAKPETRKAYFDDYPQAFDIVLSLQNAVKHEMSLGKLPTTYTPLRKGNWFIEEDFQLSLFDKPGEIKYIIN